MKIEKEQTAGRVAQLCYLMATGLGLTKPNKEKFTFDDFMPKSSIDKEAQEKSNSNKFMQQMMMLSAAMGAQAEVKR